MKKTYVSPLMVEVNIESAQMLANSMPVNKETTVNTSTQGAQLGGENRGEWGNLWK